MMISVHAPVKSTRSYSVGWLLLLITALFCVLLLDMRTQYLYNVRDSLMVYWHIPLRDTLRFPFEYWHASQRDKEARNEMMNKNIKLTRENNWLKAQLQVLSTLEAENRRLRQLMDATLQATDPVLVAELTDAVSDSFRQYIEINKGSRHGVFTGQPVIDQNGLVGQVIRVFSTRANVMLITDVRSRVPVFVERTQQRSIVAGMGQTMHAELLYVSLDADIIEGDRLITSGLGGVFPRGYPVAIVEKVERNPTESFAKIEVKAVANLDKLLEVLLINTKHMPVVVPEKIEEFGPPSPFSADSAENDKEEHPLKEKIRQ